MRFTPVDPPRVFRTGRDEPIAIRDCARIGLDPDEQVTFVIDGSAEYDVTRKEWGFYAAPSLNGRLLDSGLRAALARNHVGKYYLLLVQRGREDAFLDYLQREQNTVVRWFDAADDLPFAPAEPHPPAAGAHCMCGADRFATVHMYFDKPDGEVAVPREGNRYRREIFRCSCCGHFVSVHRFDLDGFYRGDYVGATYGSAEAIREAFERIASLPADRSDNAGRVARILQYAETHFGDASPRSVLDVGSGLCVFLHGMKAAAWSCTAIDPDSRAASHARDAVGVEAIHGDFMSVPADSRFDVVTLNKVLEHVKYPVTMLERARAFLEPRGFVYFEVPDGEAASREGFHREEFFVEHYHVFSAASAALLAVRAGFQPMTIESLREPSGKYTLRVFCTP